MNRSNRIVEYVNKSSIGVKEEDFIAPFLHASVFFLIGLFP